MKPARIVLQFFVIVSFPFFLTSCATPSRNAGVAPPQAPRAFESLREPEIQLAVELVKSDARFPANGVFPIIDLEEPTKMELASKQELARKVFLIVMDPAGRKTSEVIVDLGRKSILQWQEVKNVQPMLMMSEYKRYSDIVKADPRFQQAMRKRGIEKMEEVLVEGWAAGQFLPAGEISSRLMRGVCYLKGPGEQNYYGRPIEGVIPTVNMSTGQLVELIDTGVVAVASSGQQLDPDSLGPVRKGLKPLLTKPAGGFSFEVQGNEVIWQNWKFQFSMHPREGLVLHQVSYLDKGRERSILDRASLSETVVPYGDPDPHWSWRNAFDEGEYGLGRFSVSVEKDAPPGAQLIDVVMANEFGQPELRKSLIGIYEKDAGVLWRHTSEESTEVRRGRHLVIFSVVTIGNYDYSVAWIFKQDGSLSVDVAASGIMLPKGVEKTAPHLTSHSAGQGLKSHGHAVTHQISAPHHQHFFNFRLDFAVDGPENSVAEMDTQAMSPGKGNPTLNAMIMRETVIRSESEARRDLNPQSARKWRVFNPSVQNAWGENTGYLLMPNENSPPFVHSQSVIRRRAGFMDHGVWVTRFNPKEMFAAGDYPNQSQGPAGLPLWVKNKEPLQNQDLVVWYTMGLTHTPRPEEWPVMPAAHAGFSLLPAGFFDQNPALDLPVEIGSAH